MVPLTGRLDEGANLPAAKVYVDTIVVIEDEPLITLDKVKLLQHDP